LCKRKGHNGKNCTEAAVDEIDQEFQNFVSANGLKRCPVCGNAAEKLSGCNFLYCCSSVCKQQTFFCNLCGKILYEKWHISHFKTAGPYGTKCNTFDGIIDEP